MKTTQPATVALRTQRNSRKARKSGLRRGILAASIAALLGMTASSHAATSTWKDTGVSFNWGEGANWLSGIAPVNNDDIVIDGGAGNVNGSTNRPNPPVGTTPFLINVNSITIAAGQAASSLGGGQLTIGAGGVTNNSANTITLNFVGTGVTLGAAQTWNAAAGALNVTAAVNLNGQTLTVSGANNTTIGGSVFGSGGLIKNGAGNLIITNALTLDGGATLNAGTVTANGGLNITGGAFTGGGTLAGSLNYTSTTGGFSAFAGAITGAGSTVTMNNELAGSGNALDLTGANTYGGGTTVTSGFLEVSGAGTLGSGNVVVGSSAASTATLAVAGNATVTNTVTINGVGSSNFNPLVGALYAFGNTTSTFSGAVTVASNASVVVDGGSILNFTGGISNAASILNFTTSLAGAGTVNVDTVGISGGGSVVVNGLSVTFTANNSYSGTTTVNSGTLNVNGTTSGTSNVFVNNSASLNIGAAGNLTTPGTVNIANTATLTGTGTLTGNLNYTSTGGFDTFGGTIAGAASTVTVNNELAGSGNALNLAGANTYGGGTTVTSGFLEVSGAGTLGSGNVVVGSSAASAATVAVGGNATVTNTVTINGVGSSNFNPLVGALYAFGNTTSTFSGAVTVASNASVVVDAGSILNFTGGIIKNGTTLTFEKSLAGAGTINIGTIGISGAAANSDLVVSAVTVNENVANTYNGPTWITNGGTLNANVADALPTANGRSAVIMDPTTAIPNSNAPFPSSGSSKLALTASQTIASLTGAASSTVNLNATTLTIGAAAGSTTFAGVISGAGGAIIKDSASTQVFSGINTYSGGTTISGGFLSISNDNNLGATTGGVTFNNNATLQTTAGVTFAAARTFTVNATGGMFDTFNQTSTINGAISGAGVLNFINSSGTGFGKVTLTADNSGLTGGILVGDASGNNVTVAVSADNQLGAAAATTGIQDNATLEMTASFSTARPFNFPNSIGNLQIDPGVTTTLTGPITGPLAGAMQKLSTGILIITGNNPAFAGGTILSGGTLFGNANQAFGTGFINILTDGVTLGSQVSGTNFANQVLLQADVFISQPAAGTLTLSGPVVLSPNFLAGTPAHTVTMVNPGSVSFSGVMSGTGGITYDDTGAGLHNFTLAGTAPNTYTGPTRVLDTTFLLLASTGNAIPGALTIDNTAVVEVTAAEQIANAASVTVNSPGQAPFGGLQLTPAGTETIGSLFGSAAGVVALGSSTLTVGAGDFAGVITDGNAAFGTGGKLVKNTPGTLTLRGTNAYTGGTTINAGTLAAGNTKAFGSGNLTMTGGTLKTTGPLSVDIGAGNILFSGGTFQANIGGTSPGVTHDQLKTTGTATISGGTLGLVQLNNFHLSIGDKVVLLSAPGGVAGGSANGTADPNVTGAAAFASSPLLMPVVNLYTDSVVLELMQGSFAGVLGLTPNQLSVAHALDSVTAKLGGKVGGISEINFLDMLSAGAIGSNLDKIAPDELTSIFNIAVSLANVQSANVQRHLAEVRSESEDGGAAGGVSATGGGAHGPVGRPSKAVPPPENERWGLWFTGSGEFTRVGSTTNAAGFSLDSGGVTAGVDYRFTDHFVAGISLGYMNTTASLVNGGKVDVDGGRVGVYATWFDGGLHLDAAVSGGFNSYNTRRITPNNTTAIGRPDGSEINVLFAAGYDWKFGGLTIGPTASFQYTNVQLDGFTETGPFAPLRIAGKNAESTRSALGVRATFDTKVGSAILRPEVRASWQHEFGDTTYSLTSSFATLGGNPFTVSGPAIGRDSLLVGAGVSVLFNDRFSVYAFYDGELLRQNYSSHNISAGFRWKF